jgi:hypothetical protein
VKLSAVLLPALLVAVIGCGSSDESPPGPPADAPDPTASWTTIISADWSVPEGTEGYVCARVTVPEDLWIAGFAAPQQLGTHHALLTVGVPDAPDGVAPCKFDTVFAITAFGAAADTKPLEFPAGVATKIPGGAQLLLNVHISNTSSGELSGTYNIRANTISESEVVERAEHFAVGTQRVSLPARTTTTSTGHCQLTNDFTLVAVAPHMHMLGKHEKVVAETGGDETTLFDAPFKFGEQTYKTLDSVKLVTGDRLRVECTHENTTDQVVINGPTSANEMCMATFYRYPVGGLGYCAEN